MNHKVLLGHVFRSSSPLQLDIKWHANFYKGIKGIPGGASEQDRDCSSDERREQNNEQFIY